MKLRGLIRLQYAYDVGEEIDLSRLQAILKIEKPDREPGFRHQARESVKFERPPLEERLAAVRLATGEHFPCRIRYFDYGVLAVELELSFESGWPGLRAMAAKWIAAPEIEAAAEETTRRQTVRIKEAIKRPAARLLAEDYAVVELRSATDDQGTPAGASQLLREHGVDIAQIVRGESLPLSDAERQEVLAASLSYSTGDLIVAGWTASLVYDTQPGGSEPALILLEYANTQLLEFRHYDLVLTDVLAKVYDLLEHRTGYFRRWRMAREAAKLNTLLLEIRELTERADNAIKFLSDMFYARVYRLAAQRIGVPDYRALVDEKLKTAGELYRFLMEEFHHARAFTLELMVVIILIIDLIYLFKGKA